MSRFKDNFFTDTNLERQETMEYDNELSGVLFKNDKKSEKSPDYTGRCQIGNREYRMAAWIKQGKKGKFMSLAFQDAEDESWKDKKPSTDVQAPPAEFNDDIPF